MYIKEQAERKTEPTQASKPVEINNGDVVAIRDMKDLIENVFAVLKEKNRISSLSLRSNHS